MAEAPEGDEEMAISLETLKEEYIPQVACLFREAFSNKRCCGCFPMMESNAEMKKRYTRYPREKWELGAVALQGDTVLGFCQLTHKGLPTYPPFMHTCRPDEMYIETIAVSSEARGQGIGSRLLQWSEGKARSTEGISILSLEVFKGNRALGLYKQFGFKIVKKDNEDCVDEFCEAICACCFFGRPYGCFHPEWGTHYMVKNLH